LWRNSAFHYQGHWQPKQRQELKDGLFKSLRYLLYRGRAVFNLFLRQSLHEFLYSRQNDTRMDRTRMGD
jgi:hypothetical protein